MQTYHRILIAIAFFVAILVAFYFAGKHVNRPLEMTTSFSNTGKNFRVVLHSDTLEYDPVPYWQALRQLNPDGMLDLDIIIRNNRDADLVVYFLSSWSEAGRLPEIASFSGSLVRDLKANDPAQIYVEYRSRMSNNRDLHIIFFNRAPEGILPPSPFCLAEATIASVQDWTVPFDFAACARKEL